MARYRVLELSFIGDRLREPDEEIDFDGLLGSHLLPLDAAARKAMKAAEAQAMRDADVAALQDDEADPLELV